MSLLHLPLRYTSFMRCLLLTLALSPIACKSIDGDSSLTSRHPKADASWNETRAKQQAALDQHLHDQNDNFAWFTQHAVGHRGVPYFWWRLFPELGIEDENGKDLWNDDWMSEVGFFKDDPTLRSAPRSGFGTWWPVNVPYGMALVRGKTVNPGSPDEKPQLMKWHHVDLTCGSCHTGRVRVGDNIVSIYGGPNNNFDAHLHRRRIFLTMRHPNFNPARIVQAKEKLRATLGDDWLYPLSKITNRTMHDALLAETKIVEGLLADPSHAIMVFAAKGSTERAEWAVQHYLGDISYGSVRNRLNEGNPGGLEAFGITTVRVIPDEIGIPPPLDPFPPKAPPAGTPPPPPAAVKEAIALSMQKVESQLVTFRSENDCVVKASCSDKAWSDRRAERLAKGIGNKMPPTSAIIDIMSIWGQSRRKFSQWDGNVTSPVMRNFVAELGISSDPRLVSYENAVRVTAFTDQLPATPYPFNVDMARAARGKAIFDGQCAGCHEHNMFVPLAGTANFPSIGTDRGRSVGLRSDAFNALASNLSVVCSGDDDSANSTIRERLAADPRPAMAQIFKKLGDECFSTRRLTPADGAQFDKFAAQVLVAREENPGYMAPPLDGIWARAPYLHNGSVPTLDLMMNPRTVRNAALVNHNGKRGFWRGNWDYDTAGVGFFWKSKRDDFAKFYEVSDKDDGSSNFNGGHEDAADATVPRFNVKDSKARADLLEHLKTL